jgi:hypothetical protein
MIEMYNDLVKKYNDVIDEKYKIELKNIELINKIKNEGPNENKHDDTYASLKNELIELLNIHSKHILETISSTPQVMQPLQALQTQPLQELQTPRVMQPPQTIQTNQYKFNTIPMQKNKKYTKRKVNMGQFSY